MVLQGGHCPVLAAADLKINKSPTQYRVMTQGPQASSQLAAVELIS